MELKKGIFPFHLTQAKYLGITLPCAPDVKYFNIDHMKTEKRAACLSYLEEFANQPYSFDENLVSYCLEDCRILAKGLACFIKSSLELTDINPLATATLASFAHTVQKYRFLEDPIPRIPELGYCGNQTQSLIALSYIQYREQRDGIEYIYKLRGGEKTVRDGNRTIRFDAYHEATNTVLEIHGLEKLSLSVDKFRF